MRTQKRKHPSLKLRSLQNVVWVRCGRRRSSLGYVWATDARSDAARLADNMTKQKRKII